MKKWVFYSIYISKTDYLESIITNIVTPAIQKLRNNVQVHKWFFIRYVDLQGPHIRLRCLVNDKDVAEAEGIIEGLIQGKLSKIADQPLPKMKRLLPVKMDSSEFETCFQQEDYEPEYEKYGGHLGVEIAETIFESSSELAISFFDHAYFSDNDRFDLALLLMKITAEQASLSDTEKMVLWEKMLHYWSGADYSEDNSYKINLKTAAKKRVDVISRVVTKTSSDSLVKNLIEGYRSTLDLAFKNIKTTKKIKLSSSHLAFHYIHMMNNRLGVWPIEEAYLGALLEQAPLTEFKA